MVNQRKAHKTPKHSSLDSLGTEHFPSSARWPSRCDACPRVRRPDAPSPHAASGWRHHRSRVSRVSWPRHVPHDSGSDHNSNIRPPTGKPAERTRTRRRAAVTSRRSTCWAARRRRPPLSRRARPTGSRWARVCGSAAGWARSSLVARRLRGGRGEHHHHHHRRLGREPRTGTEA